MWGVRSDRGMGKDAIKVKEVDFITLDLHSLLFFVIIVLVDLSNRTRHGKSG